MTVDYSELYSVIHVHCISHSKFYKSYLYAAVFISAVCMYSVSYQNLFWVIGKAALEPNWPTMPNVIPDPPPPPPGGMKDHHLTVHQ